MELSSTPWARWSLLLNGFYMGTENSQKRVKNPQKSVKNKELQSFQGLFYTFLIASYNNITAVVYNIYITMF
jgi:hypothetical protein